MAQHDASNNLASQYERNRGNRDDEMNVNIVQNVFMSSCVSGLKRQRRFGAHQHEEHWSGPCGAAVQTPAAL